jgi:hypothetical protein
MSTMSVLHHHHRPVHPTAHPVAWSVGGLYAGAAYLIVVPGVVLALVASVLGTEGVVPTLAAGASLLVPVGLLGWDRGRRFTTAMLLGMAVVAATLGALALWWWLLVVG